MVPLRNIYRPSLALLTDLYQLTMAYGYYQSGFPDKRAVFHLFFRKNPFNGGYAIACGLEQMFQFLDGLKFEAEDLSFLKELTGHDGQPLFSPGFLDYLAEMTFAVDIAGVREGTPIFPYEPLLRVEGPIIQCQILETPLLNILNFQTLIATKASRICYAARGEPILEFGLRRAQGIDGALSASRAAFVGGCHATSNILAGRLFGIPVKGTHAHSWVMSFDDEEESFAAYAEAMPNNCVFLVDTYDTLKGVEKAIRVGRSLREKGHDLLGIRLDSGDLAYLSKEARKLLDSAGFPGTAIIASNDLDEGIITSLKEQGAAIGVWGVGTKLATAFDQPALGGVYKLGALQGDDGRWVHRVKLSEQSVKISNPGIQQIRRFRRGAEYIGDAIFDIESPPGDRCVIVDPLDSTRQKALGEGTRYEDLLVPMMAKGERIFQSPTLVETRDFARAQLDLFYPGIRRFMNPHQYPVGLEKSLHQLKTRLVLLARGFGD